MILKLDTENRRLKLYKNYINDYCELTLIYFMTRSNIVSCGEYLQQMSSVTKGFVCITILITCGCLTLLRGYIHLYYHNFQISFPEQFGK